jgi:plasmid stabilization system protein ParE
VSRYLLSPAAQADLEQIWDYTHDHWGIQAILSGRGLSREMGRLRRLTGAGPVHHLLPGNGGGSSRWAWLGCANCRAINDALARAWGFRPLALGRHSLMNGIGVRGGAPPEVRKRQITQLAAFAGGDERLRDWRRQEYRRLAAEFDPLADVPLAAWQQEYPPGWRASADAFTRLLGRELPLRPLNDR